MRKLLGKTLQPAVEWLNRLAGVESAAPYRNLVEHSLVGVYLIQDGRFPYCNPRMAEIFGYGSREELVRECTVTDLVWPPDRDLVLGNIRRRLEKEVETIHYGFRGRRKDSSMIEVEVLGSRVQYRGRPAVIGTLMDVTAERRARRELNLYASALANTAEAVMVLDEDRRILSINKAFQNISGYSEAEVRGESPDFLRSGRHHESHYRHIWKNLPAQGHWRGELWFRRRNGEIFPALVSLSLVDTGEGGRTHYVCVINDITGYRQIEQKLDFLSHYDPLTELPNRALLTERLGESLRHANGHGDMVAVLMLDLDAFQRINESFGHTAGDSLLVAVADRLRECTNRGQTVARMGGDEFAVVIHRARAMEDVTGAASRLLGAFDKPFRQNGHEIYTTASIGIGVYPQDGDTADALLKQADAALYEAKERGRNLYQFASGELNTRALETLTLANALRQSLERDEFHLAYQPIVDLEDGRVTGMEALLRWTHEELGAVEPDRFIPVAEQSGQISAIGGWVLRRACAEAARWRDTGLGHLTLAVNVSLHQLNQPDFVETVAAALNRHGLKGELLRVEITESVMMSDPEHIRGVLERLTAIGVRVAVDDFGKGYSSLGYLKVLPVHYLKIDREFVRDLPHNRDDLAITRAITAMAHSLNIGVIAEGVESEGQRRMLMEAGCREGQGRLFSMPVTADRLPAVLDPPTRSRA